MLHEKDSYNIVNYIFIGFHYTLDGLYKICLYRYTVYKKYALTKRQLLELKDAIDRHYDNFTQWICKEYPELNVDDIDYCCLYYLGLKEADISVFMQRAYPTVCERSRKLKRIFNSDKPLNIIIQNIITMHCTKAPYN